MPNPVDSLVVAWLADEGEFTKGVKQDGVLHAYGDNQILGEDDGQSNRLAAASRRAPRSVECRR